MASGRPRKSDAERRSNYTSTTLTDVEFAALKKFAANDSRSVSATVRQILVQHLAGLIDQPAAAIEETV